MKYWFTSDYHLGHANIIKYCNRPFKNLKQMEEIIIRNHNARVKPEDTVFHVGDFCFKNTKGGKKGEGELTRANEYLEKLNGRFVFISGNHDKHNSLKTCIKSIAIRLAGESIFLTHRPEDFNKNYKINLVGHVHEKWKTKIIGNCLLINVGCDQWKFMPINIQEITKLINKKLKSSQFD